MHRKLFIGAAAAAVLLIAAFLAARSSGNQAIDYRFEYDDAGRVTKVTDPAGKTTRFQYELDPQKRLHRIVRKTSGDAPVTINLDAQGRRASMTDGEGTVAYKHDPFGQLIEVRREDQPAIRYERDTFGRVTSAEIAGQRLGWRYDFLGRVEEIETPAGAIRYDYRENQVIRSFPNGARSIHEWNPDGSLKSITHAAADNHIIKQFSYGYRPDGLISSIHELTANGERTQSFAYDQVQRLIKMNDTRDGESHFRYDPTGNMIEMNSPQSKSSSEYDWAGRMTRHDGHPVTHDGAGNLTSYRRDGQRSEFSYTGANQLREASDGKGSVRYRFDGDGNLINRESNNAHTSFIPNPESDIWQPLLAINQASGRKTLYVWEGDTPIAAITDGHAEFFLNDHLGSVAGVTDTSGALAREFDYGVFGDPVSQFDGAALRPGFAGLFYDPLAEVYLTRSRGYEPKLSRFFQPDPHHRLPRGSQKDLSAYAYCGNDPINYVDMDGADPKKAQSKNQPPDHALQNFLNEINRKPSPHHQSVLVTGVGSGTVIHDDNAFQKFMERTGDRFDAIDTRSSNRFGGGADLLERAVTGGLDVTGMPRRQIYTADLRVTHSGGADINAHGSARNIQIDTSPQVFSEKGPDDINVWVHDIVPTGIKLWGNNDTIGAKVSFKFDGSPLVAVKDAIKEPGKIARGAFNLATKGVSSHYMEPYLDRLENSQKIPAKGTFAGKDKIWYSREGTFLIHKDESSGRWVKRPLQENQPSLIHPGGGSAGGDVSIGIRGTPLIGSDGPSTPSNVGGIWLAGIGEAMKKLTGTIKGVAFDRNTGRLVLISEEQGQMALPPLRMEDIATIFRSVYRHGEAPWVTIDPDPARPNGQTMIVRGGQGTEESYVHWVLYEADRHMKSLNLQINNLTQQKVTTKVPGYKGIFEFDSGGGTGWEKFWILPSSVERRQTRNADLTLLDVPLKVETEPMEMRRGRLVSARNRKPSPAAEYFSKWFTEHFDEIADEHYATPPPDSGVQTPVPVFQELRRIALIAAVAENLRDSGAPLPQWIGEVPPAKVSVAKTTPAITVQEKKGNLMRRIYGGATLSPADDAVRTLVADSEAESLAPSVWRAVNSSPLLTPVSFEQQGKQYKAIALPGAETRDLAPVRLTETDLAVPVHPGGEIQLARSFNSFFKPAGELGDAWSLDFPRLEKMRRPTKRTQNEVQFAATYQLTSPLLSYAASFSKQQFVAEVNGTLIAADKPGEWLGAGNANEAVIGAPTTVLYFRDGRRWHFADDGNLVAAVEAPYTVIYRWSGNRLRRIEGWVGKQLRADVRLDYDEQHRLRSATASNGARSEYFYEGGLLHRVQRFDGQAEYDYNNGLLVAVRQNGQPARQFEYLNQLGQLRKERWGEGEEIAYSLSGSQIILQRDGSPTSEESVQYDAALRPARRVLTDGTRIEWKRSDRGDAEAVITSVTGEQYVYSRNAGANRESWRLPEGGTYHSVRDGRTVTLFQEDREMARQFRRADGQMEKVVYETFEVHPSYDEDGVMNSMMITERVRDSRFSRWLKVEFDGAGRAVAYADYAGAATTASYDQMGVAATRSTVAGVQINRDADGRIQTVQTSLGEERRYAYDATTGLPTRVEIVKGGHRALIEFASGKPGVVRGFDGAETRISYFVDGENKDQVESIRDASGLAFAYQYVDGRIERVSCTAGFLFKYLYDSKGRIVRLSQAPTG